MLIYKGYLMKQTVIFFAILIGFFLYWFMGTMNNIIEDTDVSIGIKEKTIVSGGSEIISFNGVSMKEKKKLWNNSTLKVEMISLLPNFSEIKYFVEENVDDDEFKKLLLSRVEDLEFKYIGGSLTVAKAKQELSKI